MTNKKAEKNIRELYKLSKSMKDALKREDIGEVFSIIKYSIQLCYVMAQYYSNIDNHELHNFYKAKYIRLIEMKSKIEIPLFGNLAVFRSVLNDKPNDN